MDVFDLQAKIRLDDSAYKSGLSAIKGTLGDFAKFSTATLGAAAAGVSAIVKESVSAYADYEQLAGGIQTIFEDLSWDVEQNANQAFKTAGPSVNEYLETAMSFSASLNQSLKRTDGNIARSADLTDMAIRDMSDNANKMGTAMDSIQTAYAGFAKQNYTMLDNLKLGYGGTKTEMERLLADASAIAGVEYDISNYSDVIEAIHTIQQDMGITGTTAKEASETISGSIGSVKAAWQNLKVEISKDDGDIGTAFDNLSETAGAAFDNMLPRVEKALDGVGSLIVKAAPKIGKSIAKVVPKVLPSLMETSVSVISSIGTSIVDSLPTLLETGSEVVETIGNTLLGYLPDWLSDDIKSMFSSIGDMVGNINFDRLKDAFGGLTESLEPLAEKLSGGIAWAFDNVVKPFGEWLMNEALPTGIDALSNAFEVLDGVLEFLKTPAKAVWEEFLQPLATNVGDFAVGSLDLLGKALGGIADEIEGVDWEGFWLDIENFGDNWKTGAQGIADFLDDNFDTIKEFFSESEFGESWFEFWSKTGELIETSVEGWIAFFKQTIDWINDFKDAWVTGFDAICDAVDKLADKLSAHWDFWEGFGGYLADKFNPTIDSNADGGYVTTPRLSWVAEKEPEYIIPESKMDKVFKNGGSSYTFNFYYQGGNGMSDAEVEEQARRLAELSIAQIRAIGGTGF